MRQSGALADSGALDNDLFLLRRPSSCGDWMPVHRARIIVLGVHGPVLAMVQAASTQVAGILRGSREELVDIHSADAPSYLYAVEWR